MATAPPTMQRSAGETEALRLYSARAADPSHLDIALLDVARRLLLVQVSDGRLFTGVFEEWPSLCRGDGFFLDVGDSAMFADAFAALVAGDAPSPLAHFRDFEKFGDSNRAEFTLVFRLPFPLHGPTDTLERFIETSVEAYEMPSPDFFVPAAGRQKRRARLVSPVRSEESA